MYQLEVPSLAISTRQQVLEQFWDNIEPSSTNSTQDDCYFEYFETQFRTACQSDDAYGQICTVRNVCNIVHQIKEGKTREAIKAELCSKIDDTQNDDEEPFDNTIDLTTRLWLMVHMGKVPRGVTGQSTVAWKQGYLQAAIAYQFQHQLILTDSVKFEKIFNLRNVERIADVKIQWTPNLIDHLKFNEDGKKPVLNVFHHATFLDYHNNRQGSR
jgi:hypothetical protein